MGPVDCIVESELEREASRADNSERSCPEASTESAGKSPSQTSGPLSVESTATSLWSDASSAELPTEPEGAPCSDVEQQRADGAINIEVVNLTYQIRRKTWRDVKKTALLDGVSASALHGEILAVAGPSGAGKSTFLDVLAGNIQPSSLKGSILVNGSPAQASFRSVCGYVMQSDQLYPMLTARETLMYSARLQLPAGMPHQERKERVEGLLHQLGLTSCADTIVGSDDVRGISGGEKRRVSIGVDLVHDPRVLLLDEPTSGLDSAAALKVVQILTGIAATQKRTIVMTIHQPSARIINLIPKFLLLSRGQVVYHGPLNAMKEYFESLGVPNTGIEGTSPLDFAIDTIHEAERCHMEIAKHQGAAKWPSSVNSLDEEHAPLSLALPSTSTGTSSSSSTSTLASSSTSTSASTPSSSPSSPASASEPSSWYTGVNPKRPAFCNSFLAELFILCDRSAKNVVRTKELFIARIVIFILCGLIAGTLFRAPGQDPAGIKIRFSFFAYSISTAFFTATDGIPAFLQDRWMYTRETSRGAYRTLSYVLAGTLVHLPFLLVLAFVYSPIPYFMVGLVPQASNFFVFTMTMFLSLAVANSFVSFIASVSPSAVLGTTLSTVISGVFFLFSGFFIDSDKIPPYWRWMNYLSTFKYPLQMLAINEFGANPSECWSLPQNGIPATMSDATQNLETMASLCPMTSQVVLSSFGVQDTNTWVPVLAMLMFFVGYRVLFLVMLKLQTASKRA